MVFARIGHGPCYYHWNEIFADVAGVGVKISWVKQLFVILPELRLELLSLGMGTWNAASKELIFYKNVKKKLTKET